MANVDRTSEVPEILRPENLPPEFQTLNSAARQELASGAVNDLGNAPTIVGKIQPLAAHQSQTKEPMVNSLTWMKGIAPPDAEAGVPVQLRDTPASGEILLGGDEVRPHHRQTGVSPGNAEAEEEDWEHPYGG